MRVLSQKSQMKKLKFSFIPLWCGVFLVFFFFCIDISCWLFFWEALKPKTCAPLSRTERWLFVEFLFVSEATATIKIILG